ncbi:F-actin capping protein alpha subunit [Schizosaccharomyces cryophilus OY26]|uniref:F-actin-capping protein subunit alpha n=1 Tax=Schizosaccharomyces cryophilus (strain OY26 / ATCC MYA-4695 / CBS 11777 / NBRC 106824 / NRRL Y48691) TaxID=653667 RepID=S9X0E7_SCHCR|nr:F-actin capping protein alpha subunit [Schizosaccharomyces cryophilus OY26]EPY50422.1 F-actin capping protein alpha subunit [Schizosaccharomyces cryophilus OY26]
MDGESIYRFIRESPPGEVNQVVQDLRELGLTDEERIQKELQLHHEDSNSPVTLSKDERVVLSAQSKLDNGRYYDQRLQKSFAVNYETMEAIDVEDYKEKPTISEDIVKQIQKVTLDHYLSDVSIAIIQNDVNVQEYSIILVSLKYNPQNYYNGRWRCVCKYDTEIKKLVGTSFIRVHYYEDGNVWLDAERPIDVSVNDVGKLSDALTEVENANQRSFNVELSSLNDKKFKELRRQLPITRQKINWENVLGIRMRNA